MSSDFFSLKNIFAPLGTLFVFIVKLYEPHTELYLRQVAERWKCKKKVKLNRKDRHRYQSKGEQLDIVMSRSIVIETLYITIRTILTQTEKNIESSLIESQSNESVELEKYNSLSNLDDDEKNKL